jgi:hypothetical protein
LDARPERRSLSAKQNGQAARPGLPPPPAGWRAAGLEARDGAAMGRATLDHPGLCLAMAGAVTSFTGISPLCSANSSSASRADRESGQPHGFPLLLNHEKLGNLRDLLGRFYEGTYPRNWRRGWDSNPRARFWQARRFRGAPVMTTSVPLREIDSLTQSIIESVDGCFDRLRRKNSRIRLAQSSFRTPVATSTR